MIALLYKFMKDVLITASSNDHRKSSISSSHLEKEELKMMNTVINNKPYQLYKSDTTNTTNIVTSTEKKEILTASEEKDGIYNEPLPSYTCTIDLADSIYIKKEMDQHHILSTHRGWKKYKVHLHGTLLDFMASHNDKIMKRFSLQETEVGWAVDLGQKNALIRIYFNRTGEQYLMRLKKLNDMVKWIDSIQAAINISMDLDKQKMPHFITLARTRYRQHVNMTTITIDGIKLAIQTCPHRGIDPPSSITLSLHKRNKHQKRKNSR